MDNQSIQFDKLTMEQAKPLIIAMKGHPGTGKSTIARSLASALNLPLIDKDDVRDSTFPLHQLSLSYSSNGPGPPGSSVSPKLLNDLSYDVIWRIASTQLRLGLGVIVDSPLSRRAHLDRLLELATDAGARLVVVECSPMDEAEWRRRLERRGAAEGASWHKPSSWQDLQRLLEGYAGCSEYDVGEVPKLVLDTTAPVGVGEMVFAVLRLIDSCGVADPRLDSGQIQ